MALKIEKYSTDEFVLAKMLFSLDKKVQSFVLRMLSHGQIVAVLDIVAKYILTFKQPEEAKKILTRYLICVNYLYFRKSDKILEEEIILEFESIEDNGLSMEILETELLDGDKLYAKIYACDAKTYGKEVSRLHNYLDMVSKGKLSISDRKSLFALYNFHDYFQIFTKFSEYKDNRRSCDLVIANALVEDYFADFEIEISDEEIIKNIRQYQIDEAGNPKPESARFRKKQLPQWIRNAKVVVGYLVNDIIDRKFDIKDVRAVSSTKLSCLVLDQEASYGTSSLCKDTNYIEFLTLNNLTEEFYIDLSKVKEFKFIYNKEEYIFSSEGIKKI